MKDNPDDGRHHWPYSRQTLDALTVLTMAELRSLAHRALRRERAEHTLQTTAIVNEAYLRLAGQTRAIWADRTQFVAVVARVIRRLLIDHERRRRAAKRPSVVDRLNIDDIDLPHMDDVDLLLVDEALERLAEIHPRHAMVVEMRYFGGMTREEIAEALNVAPATVDRDWRVAREWLRKTLEQR